MNPRIIIATVTLVALGSCAWIPGFDEVDLGITNKLNAVELDPSGEHFIAVGADGTIVRDDGTTWDLGAVEFRDIQLEPNRSAEPFLWFVVGDAGTIAVGRQSSSEDIEWLTQATGTTANLHGIAVLDESTVIAVGDEVVLLGHPTAEWGMFEWSPQPVPPGGWGQLRDVEIEHEADEPWIRAAGLAGRIWLADSTFEPWSLVDGHTDEDLVDIYSHGRICGARGTIVTCGGDGRRLDECTAKSVDDIDFVACHENGRLTADKRIAVDWGSGYTTGYVHYDESAFAISFQPWGIDELRGEVVVGDEGHAGWWRSDRPHQ